MALSTELDESLGRALLVWLLWAAPHRPMIFDDFIAEAGSPGAQLCVTQHAFAPDVRVQWARRAAELGQGPKRGQNEGLPNST